MTLAPDDRMSPLDRAGRFAAIALGCAIPVSVAADNLLLVVVLISWIAGGHCRRKLIALANPVAVAALILFGVLGLGLLWVGQPIAVAGSMLLKYLDLAFIPLFIYFFREDAARRLGLMALAGALMLTLGLSFLIKLGVVSHGGPILGIEESPVVFKFRITHNFLMAFGAFLFACHGLAGGASGRERAIWIALAALASANVLLMVEGATGQLVLAGLGLLLAAALLPRKTTVAAFACAPLAAAVLLALPGPVSERAAVLAQEIRNWQPGVGQRHSSAGLRIEFFGNSLGIIAEHPVTGVGTGGFATAYAERVKGSDMLATTNPHNEYLMIAAQTGLIGFIALIALFITQWRLAPALPTPLERNLARGLVLAMAIGCLFNSFLLDHAEGLFFAWMTGLLFAGLPAKKTLQTPS